MTFSYHDQKSGYGYAGNSLGTLVPKLSYLLRPDHLRLLRDLWRFARVGYRDLQSGFLQGKTLGDYFRIRSFSDAFLERYFYPMGAAIWSSPVEQMQAFPAEPYFHFLENHGLLRLTNRPQWRYVKGGSRSYVEAMLKQFPHPPRLEAAPQHIHRTANGIRLTAKDGSEEQVRPSRHWCPRRRSPATARRSERSGKSKSRSLALSAERSHLAHQHRSPPDRPEAVGLVELYSAKEAMPVTGRSASATT